MFYLYKLELNGEDAGVRSLLANPYRIHQQILNAWSDGGGGRVLFRLEEARRSPCLLVQSPHPARWTGAFPSRMLLSEEEREVELTIEPGQQLRFLLRANPTARRPARDPETDAPDFSRPGKRVGLERDDERLAWLGRQGVVRVGPDGARLGGFRIAEAAIRREMDQRSRRVKDSTRLVHHGVLFEGHLEVTDGAALRNTVEHGVGAGKAFGFGLLSLARTPQ